MMGVCSRETYSEKRRVHWESQEEQASRMKTLKDSFQPRQRSSSMADSSSTPKTLDSRVDSC